MGKLNTIGALLLVASAISWAQTGNPACQITAVPPLVRMEGITERLGDIVFTCSGAPGATVSGSLTVQLNAPVTNKIIGNTTLDVVMTVNNGSGPAIVNAPAQLQGTSQVVFNGLQFALGPAGTAELRITNLRADVSQSGTAFQDVVAQLALNPPGLLNFTNTRLSVGVVRPGLLATNQPRLTGSTVGAPVTTPTFAEFITAGTIFSSSRVTEGFASSFEARGPMMDSGVRILIRYSGLPAGFRLFVPASIAGSNALVPTAAGDFGGTPAGGQYVPGSGTLLLGLVSGADQNGWGGFPVTTGLTGAPLNDMQEITLLNGAGSVTYEVLDSSPIATESAQLPVFLAVAQRLPQTSVSLTRNIFMAPVSTARTASAFAPVPRFAALAPQADCTLAGDCEQFESKLVINSALLDFEFSQGVPFRRNVVLFSNSGRGTMFWKASVEYANGSDWVQIAPTSGIGGASVGVMVVATNLQPGTYAATLVIDAGSAGVARLPIRLKLNPAPPPAPLITSVGNAATFTGAVVPGSLGTLKGTNLQGAAVSVTLNGKAARLLYTSGDQINFEVPSDLTGATAQLVVTVNNVPSSAMTVNVAQSSPGIFVPGILNEDNTVNSASNPAKTGTFVQIYATGLLPAQGSAAVEAKLHDQVYTTLPYAGPAPGIPGVQQVNLMIPAGWPTMTTEVLLCSTAGGVRSCSPPVKISIMQQQ